MLSARGLLLCASGALGQSVGTQKSEVHPTLSVRSCTKSGCVEEAKSVVIDANWRWTHTAQGATNCYTGNTWDASLCPDAAACTANCVIEGANAEYGNTYGIHTSGADLQLDFVTQGPYSTNIGSRVYLLDDGETYEMFRLKNKEFTFDVDVSNLPCGLNGALYFVQMDSDGGMSKYPTNEAGAKYGTGYCDAQCPHDIKFIAGEANCEEWQPSSTDVNSGTGKYGSCCTEFDVWEANSVSTAFTAHACNVTEQTRCDGVACGDNDPTPGGSGGHRFDGVCDKNGCDFQPFRLGNESFWGAGNDFVLDTTQPVRVTTQFITDDNTDTGRLVEVRRLFRQGEVTVETPSMKVGKKGPFNSLTADYCSAELELFDDGTNFLEKGGFEATDLAFEKGMVLALSLWDDHYANMLWLDSSYPTQAEPGTPGARRGSCDVSSGDPKDVESQHGRAFVRYMNIAYGELGTTDVGPIPGPSPPSPGPSPGPTPPSPPHQCGTSAACECSPGMNNDGRNLEAAARTAGSAEACCDLCQAATGCVGWTYIPASGNECWLKDQVGQLRADGAVTSGKVNGTTPIPGPTPSPPPAPGPPHQCGTSAACTCSPAMNNNGRNMDSAAVHADNETDCCDRCQAREGCVGWTFVPKDGNACWLKDEIGSLTSDDFVTSGSIGAAPPAPTPVPPSPAPPADCPGGSLDACIDLCPSDDVDLFKACVRSCQRRCASQEILL